MLIKKGLALASVAVLVGASSCSQKVVGSILSPEVYSPWPRCMQEATDRYFFLTSMFLYFPFSLPFSLSQKQWKKKCPRVRIQKIIKKWKRSHLSIEGRLAGQFYVDNKGSRRKKYDCHLYQTLTLEQAQCRWRPLLMVISQLFHEHGYHRSN